MITVRHAAALAKPLGRSLPRLQLTAAAAVAVGLVALCASPVNGLQFASVALATGLGTALEDPSAPTIAAVPVRLLARRALTLAICLALLAATWTALLALAGLDRTWELALTIQLAALAALVLALAAALGRRAAAAGPAIVLLFVTAQLVIPQWTLTTGPNDPRWDAAQLSWAAVAAAGGLALVVLSRDFARLSVDA